MSENTLDIILRTKKSGTGAQDTQKELKELETQSGKTGDAFGGMGDTAKAAALGGLGLLASATAYAVSQAIESEKVMSATEQVIRSTGGAAGLTADEVANLAGELSAMSGADDEAIQSAENVLLTFTSIGKDVFPEATKAALDMSMALGQDLQGSVIQIGKALQDPIKGVSALAKVGVNFNDSTKETIKKMVEMNDVAGAQRIILKELNTEFGGMAEAIGNTTEGKFNKLKNAVDNLAASMGEKLLPVIGEAANAALTLITWNDKLEAAVKGVESAVRTSSLTYEDYARATLGAAVQAGFLTQAQMEEYIETGKVTDEFYHQIDVTQRVIDQTGALSREQWNYAQTVQQSMDIAAKSGLDLRNEYAGLAAAQSTLTASNDTFKKSMSDMSGAILDAATSTSELTTRQLYQAAVKDLPINAALELARSLGLVDEKNYAVMRSLANAREEYAKTGDIAAYTRAVGDLNNELDAIKTDIKIRISLSTDVGDIPNIGNPGGIGSPAPAPAPNKPAPKTKPKTTTPKRPAGTGPQRAGGGPVTMNELYPEQFVPYQPGTVMPSRQSVNYSQTIERGAIVIQASPGMDVRELAREVSVELGKMMRSRANIGVGLGL